MRRFNWWLNLALIACLILVGCGSKAQPMPTLQPTPIPAQPTAAPPTAAPVDLPDDLSLDEIVDALTAEGLPEIGELPPLEPVQVYYAVPSWLTGEGEAYAASFNVEHAGIWQANVRTYESVEQLRQLLDAGQSLDLIYFSDLAPALDLALDGWLDIGATTEVVHNFGGGEEIAGEMAAAFSDGTPSAPGFLPALLELCRDPLTGDGYAAIPVSGSVAGIWYRRDILDSRGVPAPTGWDSLVQAAQALRSWDGADGYGLALNRQWPALFHQLLALHGVPLANDSGDLLLDQQPLREAWAAYNALAEVALPGSPSYPDMEQMLGGGGVPMIYGYANMLPSLAQYGGLENLGFVAALEGPAGRAAYGWISALGILTGDDPLVQAGAKALAAHILLNTPTDGADTPALVAWALQWQSNLVANYPTEIVSAIGDGLAALKPAFMVGGYNPIAAALLTSSPLRDLVAGMPFDNPDASLDDLLTQSEQWRGGTLALAATAAGKAKEAAKAPTPLEVVLKYCEDKGITEVTDQFKEGGVGKQVLIEFLPSGHHGLGGGALAVTTVHDGTIHIYVDNSLKKPAAVHILRHELQHADQLATAVRDRVRASVALYVSIAKDVTVEKANDLLSNAPRALWQIGKETSRRVTRAWAYGMAKRCSSMNLLQLAGLMVKELAWEVDAHFAQLRAIKQLVKAGVPLADIDYINRFLDAGKVAPAATLNQRVQRDYRNRIVNSLSNFYIFWLQRWQILKADATLKAIYDRFGPTLERDPMVPD